MGKELNSVWVTKCLVVPWSNSRPLWWYSENVRNDVIHMYSLQRERIHLSQRLFVERSIYLGEWIDSGWKTKRQSTTSSLLHTLVENSDEERLHYVHTQLREHRNHCALRHNARDPFACSTKHMRKLCRSSRFGEGRTPGM